MELCAADGGEERRDAAVWSCVLQMEERRDDAVWSCVLQMEGTDHQSQLFSYSRGRQVTWAAGQYFSSALGGGPESGLLPI